MPVISCRFPMSRKVASSVVSSGSTTTRPPGASARYSGIWVDRCAVSTTDSPRSSSARAVCDPIEPRPPVTSITHTPPQLADDDPALNQPSAATNPSSDRLLSRTTAVTRCSSMIGSRRCYAARASSARVACFSLTSSASRKHRSAVGRRPRLTSLPRVGGVGVVHAHSPVALRKRRTLSPSPRPVLNESANLRISNRRPSQVESNRADDGHSGNAIYSVHVGGPASSLAHHIVVHVDPDGVVAALDVVYASQGPERQRGARSRPRVRRAGRACEMCRRPRSRPYRTTRRPMARQRHRCNRTW
jgi:hypothetical protein